MRGGCERQDPSCRLSSWRGFFDAFFRKEEAACPLLRGQREFPTSSGVGPAGRRPAGLWCLKGRAGPTPSWTRPSMGSPPPCGAAPAPAQRGVRLYGERARAAGGLPGHRPGGPRGQHRQRHLASPRGGLILADSDTRVLVTDGAAGASWPAARTCRMPWSGSSWRRPRATDRGPPAGRGPAPTPSRASWPRAGAERRAGPGLYSRGFIARSNGESAGQWAGPLARGSRCPVDPYVHVGHHRQAQGRHAVPPQHRRQRGAVRGHPLQPGRPAGHRGALVPLLGAHQRRPGHLVGRRHGAHPPPFPDGGGPGAGAPGAGHPVPRRGGHVPLHAAGAGQPGSRWRPSRWPTRPRRPPPWSSSSGCATDFGIQYAESYGLTETSPVITTTHWRETRPGSCGRAVGDTELKVVAPAGTPQPPGRGGRAVGPGHGHHAGLLAAAGRHRGRPSRPTGGLRPATSSAWTGTATSTSSTGSRT